MIFDCRRKECPPWVVDILSVAGFADQRTIFSGDEEKAGNRKPCTCMSRMTGMIAGDTAGRSDDAVGRAS